MCRTQLCAHRNKGPIAARPVKNKLALSKRRREHFSVQFSAFIARPTEISAAPLSLSKMATTTTTTPDAPTKSPAEIFAEYIEKHRVKERLEEAMNVGVQGMPEDPPPPSPRL